MTTPEVYASLPVDRYYGADRTSIFWQSFDPIHAGESALIAGCGRGEALKWFSDRGVAVTGFDFNPNLPALWKQLGVDAQTHLLSLDEAAKTFAPGSFDWSISTDFLEHLSLDVIWGAILKLQKIAPNGIHVVDLIKETAFRGPKGESLHALGVGWNDFANLVAEYPGPTPLRLDPPFYGEHCLLTWGKGSE